MSQIILASQSKQRRLLMDGLHLAYDIIPADIDEQQVKDDDLVRRAQIIARLKAEKVAADHPQSLVIAADTYGRLNQASLEKPVDQEEAIKMLKLQSGQWLDAITGYCVIGPDIKEVGSSVTRVKFRELSLDEIKHYVANNPVTTWSAAFAPCYGEGATLIAEIEGSFNGFNYGLPLEKVYPLIEDYLSRGE